jgi:hypothetical protein
MSVYACIPSKVRGGTAPDLLCGRIETTSCAVDAEGHLNAMVVVEVVSTFSAFRLESVPVIVMLIGVEGALPMKNLLEVLRMKEQEILRVKQEIEALRITAKLLGEEPLSDGGGTVEFRKVVNLP